MSVLLEDYDAIKIRDISGNYRFFIPMDSANDIILADLGTELNTYDGVLSYEHERYIALQGVQKYRNPMSGLWQAIILARKV